MFEQWECWLWDFSCKIVKEKWPNRVIIDYLVEFKFLKKYKCHLFLENGLFSGPVFNN